MKRRVTVRMNNILKLVCVFCALCILAACGPSAEDVAKERARVDAEIQNLRNDAGRAKEEILASNETIENVKSHMKDLQKEIQRRESNNEPAQLYESMLDNWEKKLTEAKKTIGESFKVFKAAVKELKDKYEVEYKLTPKEEEAFNGIGL